MLIRKPPNIEHSGLSHLKIFSTIFDEEENENSKWQTIFLNSAKKERNFGIVHAFGRHNLAIFSTGYGDGCYSTFIGFNKQGKVCQLLIDFGIINW